MVTINKELSRLEHSSVKLTLTVGKDEIRSQYDEILNNYAKDVQIPGFRKGKTPRDVLARKFGEALKKEVLGTLIEKSLDQVFKDESLARNERPLPYSNPQLGEEPPLDLEKDLVFSVVYDVLPQVRVENWKGIEVEVPEAELSDGDINRELETVRERNAIVLDRDEEAGAEKGNVAAVNYCELNDNGEPLPGTEREDFVFTLGAGNSIYQIDDDMLGMKKDEVREIVKTYPAEEQNPSLAGRTVRLRVKLLSLKERKLPDLDDDLAQDVDEKYQTLDDLKQSIRKTLNRNLENRLRERKINGILEKLMAENPVDIPESMIRLEIETRWRSLAQRFNTTVEQLKTTMEKTGESLGTILAGWRGDSIKALHSRLLVETLMEDLKLEAGEEEVTGEIETLAAEDPSMAEEIKKYYEKDGMRDYLKEELKERKLFDILLAESVIKPGKKENYLDLMSNNS
ncbi:MAG: trigger factor [Treponema sp.]|jgi:trigger factor|nr:trigger factor [Treponema sp.]